MDGTKHRDIGRTSAGAAALRTIAHIRWQAPEASRIRTSSIIHKTPPQLPIKSAINPKFRPAVRVQVAGRSPCYGNEAYSEVWRQKQALRKTGFFRCQVFWSRLICGIRLRAVAHSGNGPREQRSQKHSFYAHRDRPQSSMKVCRTSLKTLS